MNSKTSLFNKTIIKNDIKRFWWIAVLYIIILALFMLPNAVYWTDAGALSEIIYRTDEGLLALPAAFLVGGLLFSYLHNGSALSAMHGIPVTRRSMFVSHYIAGFLIVIVPAVIASVVLGIECIANDVSVIYAFKYLYASVLYTLAMLSLIAFSAMITGNTIAAYVFTTGFVALPAFMFAMKDAIFSLNLYGYINYTYDELLEKIYIIGLKDMCSRISIWYIAFAVIMFFAALWLYSVRKLENYDDIVVFKPLKYAFMAVVAICFGAFGYLIFNDLFDLNNILFAAPLGAVALIGAHMINNKSLSFKGVLKPLIIFLIGVLGVYAVFAFDITGYEHRVPEAENVVNVDTNFRDYNLSAVYYDEDFYKGDMPDYWDIADNNFITDIEDIENITKWHKAIISNKALESDRTSLNIPYDVYFTYNLKNGSTIKRSYFIDASNYDSYISSYFGTEEYIKASFPILNDNKKEITSVVYGGIDTYNLVQLGNVDHNSLVNAVSRDVNNLDYRAMMYYKKNYNNINYIEIDYNESVEHEGKTYVYKRSQTIPIDSSFPTVSQLVRGEIAGNVMKPSDITAVTVNDVNEIKDPKAMQDIYNFVNNYTLDFNKYWNEECVNVSLEFVWESNTSSCNILIPKDSVPDVLKPYINKQSNTSSSDEVVYRIDEYGKATRVR